jgi:ELWxxDGT repeat protein
MAKRSLFVADDGVHGQELWITDGTAAGTVLVRDIFPGVGSATIGNFALLGSKVLFTADDGVTGSELWITDGTAAGTTRVRDIAPGAAGSAASGFVQLGNRLLFQADDGVNGAELWVTDGTTAGTILLKNIAAGATGSGVQSLTALGDKVVFQANDGVNGTEIWITDGTAAGTILLKDIMAGTGSSIPVQFTRLGNQLLFQATDAANGVELWTTDGTAAGTVLLKDIRAGSASSTPTGLTPFGSKVLFRADDGINGTDLWISDGTAGGTILLKNIAPGASSSSPELFTQLGDKMYFRAFVSGQGFELWVTDGTEAGTVLVKDIGAGSGSSAPGPLTVFGDKLVFQATDDANGAELWISDGTEVGTVLLKDIRAGAGSSTPTDLEVVGDKLVFRADDGVNGAELWVTDGTSAGTTLLNIPDPRTVDSFPIPLSILGDKVIFPADDGVHGIELWISDGTAAGTMLVKDVRVGADDGAASITGGSLLGPELGGFLLFRGTTSANGGELWKTDGTEAGTVLVKDIRPGASSSQAGGLTRLGNQFVFVADNGTAGAEPWVTDGTTAGTMLLRDIAAGAGGSGATGFEDLGNGKMLFRASDGIPGGGRVGVAVWVTDGTPAGTVMVKDLRPTASIASSPMGSFNVVNNKAIFSAFDDTFGWALFVSDGTNAGTFMLTDINPGTTSNPFGSFRVFGDGVVFTVDDGTVGTEVWITDGTSAGTVLLKDINVGAGGSGILSLQFFPERPGELFFTADDGIHGRELWVTDGTTAGTRLFIDLVPGAVGSGAIVELVLGDTLLLRATDAVHGDELWITDGTSQGTFLLKDINPGVASSSPVSGNPGSNSSFARDPTPFLNGFIFLANDGVHGDELWFSDGTTAGTRMIKDTAPGAAHFSAREFRVIDDLVFMRALDQVLGTELWVSDGTAAGTRLVKDINDTKLGSAPANFFTFDLAADVPPTAVADAITVQANAPFTANLLANDTDPDGGPKTISLIAGQAATIGQAVTLASGSLATRNADETLDYTYSGPANRLVSASKAAVTGAVNFQASDSFTYALNGGGSATVTVTIQGTDEAGDLLIAPSGDATMNGTAGSDLFLLTPSTALTITDAGAGDDGFYFGATFGAGDSINGGAGTGDQIALRGNYNLTFAANAFFNVETLSLLSGSVAAFEPAGPAASYNLTFVDANVAAGQLLTVNGNGLAANEPFTVNGSAETDGGFAFYSGFGAESLIGGAGNDGFFFGGGRLDVANDRVNGLTGSDDQLGLRGDFSQLVSFGSLTVRNIDTIALISAKDPRFGATSEAFSYNLKLHDDNLAAGAQLTATGAGLAADETMTLDGSAETDGTLRLFGGAGNDVLKGGTGNDQLFGGLGADQLTGNAGSDTFFYTLTSQSTAASRDTLFGFASGDRIDLSAIDAIAGGANDALTFVGSAAFTAAGQVRLVQNGAEWLLEANVDADLGADMVIGIAPTGGYLPVAADLVL